MSLVIPEDFMARVTLDDLYQLAEDWEIRRSDSGRWYLVARNRHGSFDRESLRHHRHPHSPRRF